MAAATQVHKQHRGYTLVELIIVVVIIGLTLVFSVPKLRNTLLQDNLNTTMRRIVGLVNSTREQAVRDQAVYRLHVDIDGKQIWAESGQADAEQLSDKNDVLTISEGIQIRDVWTRSSGIQISDVAIIHVNKKGYIEPAIIHLEGGGNRVVSLELKPFLGTVEIYDRYVDPGNQ